MQYLRTVFVSIFIVTMIAGVFAPEVVHADGLVPCGGTAADGTEEPDCNFDYLLVLINNIIEFVLVYLTIPIAAVMFAYAGFLLLTQGGKTESRKKARAIFFNVFIGLVIALAAWLVVHSIVTGLNVDEDAIFLEEVSVAETYTLRV